MLESIIINEVVESEELNREAKEVQDPDEVKRNRKHRLSSREGFEKFKEREKFIKLVNQLGIHKNTIIFKINAFKLCEKYPKLLRASIGLGFFKNYHKDIKFVLKKSSQKHFAFSRLSLWRKNLKALLYIQMNAY